MKGVVFLILIVIIQIILVFQVDIRQHPWVSGVIPKLYPIVCDDTDHLIPGILIFELFCFCFRYIGQCGIAVLAVNEVVKLLVDFIVFPCTAVFLQLCNHLLLPVKLVYTTVLGQPLAEVCCVRGLNIEWICVWPAQGGDDGVNHLIGQIVGTAFLGRI